VGGLVVAAVLLIALVRYGFSGIEAFFRALVVSDSNGKEI